MPKLILGLALLLVAASLSASDQRVLQSGAGHRFVCADYTQGKVFIVNEAGGVEWEHPAKSCDDVWMLPSGNVLFNTGHGVKEVTREKRVVFSYESKSEIYACQRLSNGNTFVGECNAGRLLEITPSGAIAKEIRLLPEGKDGGHLYMRNARALPNGNYLVAHYAAEVVREYDAAGAKIREFAAPGGPHSVARLPGDRTLIACGDLRKAAQVIEVDAAGKILWQVKHDEFPGFTLNLMTGLHRLPNGNTVMSNWQGHGALGSGPHILEVTPDKKLVWTFSDHKTMRTISSVQVLDAASQSTDAIWH